MTAALRRTLRDDPGAFPDRSTSELTVHALLALRATEDALLERDEAPTLEIPPDVARGMAVSPRTDFAAVARACEKSSWTLLRP